MVGRLQERPEVIWMIFWAKGVGCTGGGFLSVDTVGIGDRY